MVAARLVAGIAALAAGIAATAVAADLVRRTPGPEAAASAPLPAAPAPAPRGFPAPPPGAVVLAREDGPDALAVAVLPGRVQVSVVGGQGRGVDRLPVTIGGVQATGCGPGCYEAPAAPPLEIRVGSTAWRVDIPAHAPPAGRIVARAARAWRSLRSLAFTDRLGSDATHVVYSTWRAAAPDRLAYRVKNGYAAVVIGGRRWDRAPGGKWIESPQTARLRQPLPVWQSATDARVLADTGTAWRVSFYDPRTPAWFEILVEKRTFRTFDLRMTTTAHFMHETYGSFDSAPAITAP